MRNLFATEYLSVDGVFEEPGQWSFPFWSDEAAKFKLDELFYSDAKLMGRKTCEGIAAAWPTMTNEAGFADQMNVMPKYVVSMTLKLVNTQSFPPGIVILTYEPARPGGKGSAQNQQ